MPGRSAHVASLAGAKVASYCDVATADVSCTESAARPPG